MLDFFILEFGTNMGNKKSITSIQWLQLCVVTFSHFAADTYGSVLYAIMPAIRDHFKLSLTAGVALITILNIGCNGVQLFVGPLRAYKKKPFFLLIGVPLASTICFLGFVPQGAMAFGILAILACSTSLGIGSVHPEGLRSVHLLRRIRPALSTAFFLNAGYVGFCGGNFISAWSVYMWGLKGLLVMAILPVIQVFAVSKYRVRLAVERPIKSTAGSPQATIDFWVLFCMAVPIATTSTIVPALLPMYLRELGFELYYGGMAIAVFGMGGMAGAFFWAKLAQDKGELRCAFYASLLAGPFLILYFAFVNNTAAILLLLGVGFNATAGFILLVTLARHIPMVNLGQRMGLMVGGVWGLASVVLMVLGPVAERLGIRSVLDWSWLGYFLAASIGFYTLQRSKNILVAKS